MINKNLKRLMLLLCSILTIFMMSCTEDDPGPQVLLPKLDGLYVFGTNTVAKEPGTAASKVNRAVLDKNQGTKVANMAGVFGKFMHIGANSTISLAYVENKEGKLYGANGGGSLDSAFVVGGAVKDKVINGTLVENGTPIKVTNAGLYYLYVNMLEKKFILMEVKAQMIGDATEKQWAAGTSIALKSSDTLKTVFEATGVPLKGATGYRYRFNDGWHVYQDANIVTLSSLGVASYGEAWDSGINNIGFELDNIPHKVTGIFTINLTYDAKTGEWKETKTKTGELLIDYSNAEYGWFGNAYFLEDGTTEGAWNDIHLVKKPVKDGNKYNWTWTLKLIEGRSFVLREKKENGAWITYGGAAKLGAAFDDGKIIKETGADNYYVAKGGTYKVTFTINAEDEGRILTIVPE